MNTGQDKLKVYVEYRKAYKDVPGMFKHELECMKLRCLGVPGGIPSSPATLNAVITEARSKQE